MDNDNKLLEELKSIKKLYNFLKKHNLITITFKELLQKITIENNIFDKQILQCKQQNKTYNNPWQNYVSKISTEQNIPWCKAFIIARLTYNKN